MCPVRLYIRGGTLMEKKLRLIAAIIAITSLIACSNDANVGALGTSDPILVDVPIDEVPTEEDLQPQDPDPPPEDDIVVDPDLPSDSESDDEEVSDEEIAEENDDQESSDEEADDIVEDTPSEEEDVASEDPEESEEQEDEIADIDDESIDDEIADERCKRRGNLLNNGSFEIVDDREGLRGRSLASLDARGEWDVFQELPSRDANERSWYTESGAGIEIQGNGTVASAAHGDRMVELDSHGGQDTNSGMAQDVLLCRGRHILKFHYYARTNRLGDNIISVRINDEVVKVVDRAKDGKWHRIRIPFRVKSKQDYKISFVAEGTDNSLGALIDKIKLHRKRRRAGVVTSLLALGDQDNISSPLIREEISQSIIMKLVNFASKKRRPRILMVKDKHHHNESIADFDLIERILKQKMGEDHVEVMSGDLEMNQVDGFDLLYIVNPGYPFGSRVTAETLREVKESGKVGIILSGDDMARGRGFNIEDITGLEYKNNGTSACGIRLNNNRGKNYSVKLKRRFFPRLSKESRMLQYGNDIDHTVRASKKVRVLAFAKAPDGCDVKIPTIVGYKLKRSRSR